MDANRRSLSRRSLLTGLLPAAQRALSLLLFLATITFYVFANVCDHARATSLGHNGPMIISRENGSGSSVFAYSVGMRERFMVDGRSASLSPDQQQVAFVSQDGDDLEIGARSEHWQSASFAFAEIGSIFDPGWVPGKPWVVYGLSVQPPFGLYSVLQRVNLETGQTVGYSHATDRVADFDVSPNGSRIYVSIWGDDPKILVLSGTGELLFAINPSMGEPESISVSPDGKKLAYSSSSSSSQIYLMNIDGSDERLLFPSDESVWGPVFSPDQRFIAYSSGSWPDTNVSLYDLSRNVVRSLPGVGPQAVVTDWVRSEPLTVYPRGLRGKRARVKLYGPGKLVITGPTIRSLSRYLPVGSTTLRFRLKNQAGRRLKQQGFLKAQLRIRYMPDGGIPVAISRTVKLKP